MNDFLLELLSEEIPARMQGRARADLAKMFAGEMQKAGLATGTIEAFSTPRRLVLIARDMAAETPAAREEIKGPKCSAPAQAIDGFLRKTGLQREQLTDRDGVFFAVIDRPGRPAAAVIAAALQTLLAEFQWPKSMRWGDGSQRWVRPLHGIVAMLGEAIVPVEFAGIASGATTLGHRFHHPGTITIGGASDYGEKLRACHVIVDQEERARLIRAGAERAAADAGLQLLADDGLVVENAGLTEWPVPLIGRFDAQYLDVPREVIVLTMRTNQKYFACANEQGGLAPAFVCVANIDASDGGEAIVEGNRRVLAARLSDARFFWEQDLKVPLDEQAKKLSGIVFHEKLGTGADKVERVAKLARWLIEEGVCAPAKSGAQTGPLPSQGNKEDLADQAERAARLAKADLVTGMVGEFPELQGIIGGYLACAQDEPDAIADAIRDHYQPVGQGDDVPTAPITTAVALADKLDVLRSFFAIGEKPTGSRDPFALRRAALGVIQLIITNDLRLPVAEGELLVFLADRLKVQQREAGVRHDLIDAVFALGGEDDLVRLLARVKALQGFVETDEGRDLLAGYKRAANILKKEKGSWTPDQVQGDESAAEERALLAALDEAAPRASAAIEAEDFTAAMAALALLRAPIDAFFDTVTVNDPDAAVRARRLNLLQRFRDAVHRVADFSKIEG
ncbi:MAG: glycine--tRNA ligase subunit beta [Sphingomonas sp.]|nr:glycine--tRNA ligase subunit beta [Sphingomonas sp.]